MNASRPFVVRRAEPSDAATIAEFGARTFLDAFGAENRPEDLAMYLAAAFGPDVQAREIGDPALLYLIAEANGQTAGYALLRAGAPPASVTGRAPLELARFYIHGDWFGRGLAQVLMAECIAEARRRGARTLWLGVWERNPRAIAFYSKCGFRDVGSHTFLVGTDAQTDRTMERDLGDDYPR